MRSTQADNTRLRRANPRKQTIDLRRPNPGKEITDHLPTVSVEPDTLDLYAEVQPVDELVGAMRDKWMLVGKVEIPKWRRRKKLKDYGWGVAKGLSLPIRSTPEGGGATLGNLCRKRTCIRRARKA